ncbi:MAG: HypC/HybG/HupF family hydrogenase formation chaperone [Peptococcaceae bacterium]|nr:HypC/HybG/HupF family hydrogenase formation chaperone [Peptococcaceae bacterium]
MCLAIPGKVILTTEHTAEVDLMGNRRKVNIDLVADEVKPGDYLLIHAGYAIEKVDEEIALETLALFEEALEKSDY